MSEINEGDDASLDVSFLDESGNPYVPASITYQIDCDSTGQEVKASTPFTPPASTIVIDLTPSETAIIDTKNEKETKRITIKAIDGGGKASNEEVFYYIKNLKFIS